MSIDFRAQNIQTEKIIVSGDPDTPLDRTQLIIYPIQAQGPNLNQGEIADAGLAADATSTDVFMYVSGAIGGKGGSTKGITVFGGDLHISGNFSLDGTGGGGSGDVTGPGSAVVGRIATFANVNGKVISDGGVAIGLVSTAMQQVSGATTGRVAVIGTGGGTLTNGPRLEADLVAYGSVFPSVAGNLPRFADTTGKSIEDSGIDAFALYTTAGTALSPVVQNTHTTATRTLAATDAGNIIPIDPTSTAITVTIPHTLYAGGLQAGFRCTLVALNVTNAITLAGSGGLVLTYYGSSTITAGDIIRISVESATVCRVEVIKSGDAAGAHIANTSNPHAVTAAQVGADPKTTVQTAHTTSTLTLGNADNNQHRALDTTSNSIAISIPTDLTFPFVWTARKSSASNSVTITTGAGLITPKTSGTVPVTDVDAYITVFAESSTVAAVFVTVAT